uniref:Non-LTR retrolelement reverse transcriptase n=1 Tax=Solanum tuberosum TaxID=4113 RepID=M1AZZ0_SOLTU
MAQINFSTVWIRLPELPTEFYDLNILQQIGNQILKIDTVTMNTTRGRYARLCILAPLSRTLPRDILIGTHLQKIQYEPSTPLCTICGRLGHLVHSCPNKPNNIPSTSKNPNRTEPSPDKTTKMQDGKL